MSSGGISIDNTCVEKKKILIIFSLFILFSCYAIRSVLVLLWSALLWRQREFCSIAFISPPHRSISMRLRTSPLLAFTEVSLALSWSNHKFILHFYIVSCVQAWYYYTHQTDTWAVKSLARLHHHRAPSPIIDTDFRLALSWPLTPFIKL